ncbi:MAG TPA: TadE/TadG family type IV pilus assembly protein [Candidatus Limnocylindria bacterium]
MRPDRGQALVEFALVLPLVLVVLAGVVLVAEIGVARLALEHAAAEAARTGALTNDDDLIRATLAAAVAPLDPSRVAVAIEPTQNELPRSMDPRGSLLRVRLRYPVNLPLAFVGSGTLVVEGAAARRVEWTP